MFCKYTENALQENALQNWEERDESGSIILLNARYNKERDESDLASYFKFLKNGIYLYRKMMLFSRSLSASNTTI